MESYRKLHRLGEGAHGVVYAAEVISENLKRKLSMPDVVAIKKIRLRSSKDGLSMEAIREIKILQELNHPNIVRLFQVFSRRSNVNLVLEHMSADLEMLLNEPTIVFDIGAIKAYLLYLLRAMQFCHARWTLHRDVKPSNCLIAADGTLKISDFGLAKSFGSPNTRMSPQACTLWYRAPELLFGATSYGAASDMWSVGCVFAQLMLRVPLFAGSTELDQLSRIFSALGTPTETLWPGLTSLSSYARFEQCEGVPFESLFGGAASADALDLLRGLLAYDPLRRLTASEALEHRYFSSSPPPTPAHLLPKLPSKPIKSDQL